MTAKKKSIKKFVAKSSPKPACKKPSTAKPAAKKSLRKSLVKKAAATGRMLPPAKGVAVRMYRQGLGDCFLLAFSTEEADAPFYMLVDCGVILGTSEPERIMTRVAEDIEAATGGDIHLLVVTHEHWDHVSGFTQAREVFERMKIHNLWFAWTEDPDDELAKRLRRAFAKDREALRLAVNRALDSRSVESAAGLLEFFGEIGLGEIGAGESGALGAKISRNSTGASIDLVREFALKTNVEAEYRKPGEGPLPLPKAVGITPSSDARIYILGPPHDEQTLKRINPTAKGKEVYSETHSLTPRASFLMAVQDDVQFSSDERDLRDLSFPFNQDLRISLAEAREFEVGHNGKSYRFFQDCYGFEHHEPEHTSHQSQDTESSKPVHKADWRRIDDDWLNVSSELALQLDSYTNNTSLVMAIELINSEKVLLFVADAQVGNWLSWDSLEWKIEDSAGDRKTIRAADLLERTVLYKVGHHGSHNATVRALGETRKGLEVMTSRDLVAMVPVNHEMAVKKRWTKMPFNPLMRRLEEKTRHRILQVDDPLPKPKPSAMGDAEWHAFKSNFEETEIYLQYMVST